MSGYKVITLICLLDFLHYLCNGKSKKNGRDFHFKYVNNCYCVVK